jgi:Tfp pilus assembly protein PilF
MAGKSRPPRGRAARERCRPPLGRSGSYETLARAALIVLAGVCVFWNALDTPFLWDDQTAVLTNQTIRDLWPPSGPLLPPVETPVAARPLVNVSLALNYSLAGLDVRGYHAWNLGVHLMAALLLFGVVRRTLEGEHLRERIGRDAANVAFVAALWWSIHPLVTEVVDYTTQRTTAMMGLFFLMTLYCAIRALDPPHRARWQLLTVIACACGMASKEEMVVAPIVVALYDRLFVFSTLRDAWHARKPLYWRLATTWGGLAVLMWRWPRSTAGFGAGNAWTYMLNQAEVIPHYLRLALWPDALVVDYGVPANVSLGDVIGGGIFVAALVAAGILALWRAPRLGFLAAVFFLTLAPTSSIVPIASEVGAERRMYLPLAAIAVFLVVCGQQITARFQSSFPARRHVIVGGVLLVIAVWIGSLAAVSVSRNSQYGDPVALWRSSVQHRPHGRARLAYGVELVKAGQHDAGLAQLRLAVRDYAPAHYALGVELSAAGDTAGAIQALETFIAADASNPNRIPARLLMGKLLFAGGRLDESTHHFREVAAIAPDNIDTQLSLGDLLMTQKRYTEAVSHYRVVVRLQPNRADWRLRLGAALAETGDLAHAAEHFRAAVALDPRNELARASLNRAVVLLAER